MFVLILFVLIRLSRFVRKKVFEFMVFKFMFLCIYCILFLSYFIYVKSIVELFLFFWGRGGGLVFMNS